MFRLQVLKPALARQLRAACDALQLESTGSSPLKHVSAFHFQPVGWSLPVRAAATVSVFWTKGLGRASRGELFRRALSLPKPLHSSCGWCLSGKPRSSMHHTHDRCASCTPWGKWRAATWMRAKMWKPGCGSCAWHFMLSWVRGLFYTANGLVCRAAAAAHIGLYLKSSRAG